jgi:hypothetical protein
MKAPNTKNDIETLIKVAIRIQNGTFKSDGYSDAIVDVKADIQAFRENGYNDYLHEKGVAL